MKKMMKVFVSLLVVAMMVVLVPVQQVKATNFLLIKNSSTLQYKTSFVDEMGEGIVYSVTDYFENTHTIGFVSLENVDEEYAVLNDFLAKMIQIGILNSIGVKNSGEYEFSNILYFTYFMIKANEGEVLT